MRAQQPGEGFVLTHCRLKAMHLGGWANATVRCASGTRARARANRRSDRGDRSPGEWHLCTPNRAERFLTGADELTKDGNG